MNRLLFTLLLAVLAGCAETIPLQLETEETYIATFGPLRTVSLETTIAVLARCAVVDDLCVVEHVSSAHIRWERRTELWPAMMAWLKLWPQWRPILPEEAPSAQAKLRANAPCLWVFNGDGLEPAALSDPPATPTGEAECAAVFKRMSPLEQRLNTTLASGKVVDEEDGP